MVTAPVGVSGAVFLLPVQLVIGAVIRVYAVPGPGIFRLFVALLLLPLGLWLAIRTLRPARHRTRVGSGCAPRLASGRRRVPLPDPRW